MNTFNDFGLSPEIIRALEGLSFQEPTKVQQKVIPEVLAGRDVIVKSQTGSGKTAAFGIPLCESMVWNENKPQALILTPTRELAQQINEDLTNIGRFKRLKSFAVYGKSPFKIQAAVLKQRTHFLVGTPGRVLDHLEKGTLSVEKINYLVIDEADEMLNMGFIEQVSQIIERLPTKRTTMLFSATYPEDVMRLSRKYMNHPTEVEIKVEGLTTVTIDHEMVDIGTRDKFSVLMDVLTVENPTSCIIFCRTQDNVESIYRQLDDHEIICNRIHGGMEQDLRFEVMQAFRLGKFRYLVATDVAARGIDITDISHVINFDIPLEKESYVHRTGRTGRAGKAGKAITLVTAQDKRRIAEIEEYIGFSINRNLAPTLEEVQVNQLDFEKKSQVSPVQKMDKRQLLNQEIIKLNFNGGKKKKLRAVDFVGTIAKIDGVNADDIGIITILDHATDVEILNGKGELVLEIMRTTPVKGKQLKVRKGMRA